MRRTILGTAAVVLLVSLVLAAPASAITNGEPDSEGRYPMVGVVVLEVPTDDGVEVGTQCSGVLVSATVFLTAGHCTYNAVNVWQYTRAWVNFSWDVDDADPLNGEGQIVEVAEMYWHPQYRGYPPYPSAVQYDLGVMTLREPVALGAYAALPPPGLFDHMMKDGSLASQTFTAVGYGCSAAWPAPSGPQPWRLDCRTDRTIGTSAFLALTPYWVKVSRNYPSTGSSGQGPGDSGAPFFLGETYTLAGVMGNNGDAAGTAFGLAVRLDTPPNRSFVAAFLAA